MQPQKQRNNHTDAGANTRELYDPRLNIYDPAELCYWAQQFGVSRSELMHAVDKAGTSLEGVRNQLRDGSAAEGRMLWKAKAT